VEEVWGKNPGQGKNQKTGKGGIICLHPVRREKDKKLPPETRKEMGCRY